MYDEALTCSRSYQSISVIAEFLNEDGSDSPRQTIEAKYNREAGDTKPCRQRVERIKNDVNLSHLFKE